MRRVNGCTAEPPPNGPQETRERSWKTLENREELQQNNKSLWNVLDGSPGEGKGATQQGAGGSRPGAVSSFITGSSNQNSSSSGSVWATTDPLTSVHVTGCKPHWQQHVISRSHYMFMTWFFTFGAKKPQIFLTGETEQKRLFLTRPRDDFQLCRWREEDGEICDRKLQLFKLFMSKQNSVISVRLWDNFQLRWWWQKNKNKQIFDRKSGHEQPCLSQQNWVVLIRPPDKFQLCLWEQMTDFSQEVSTSPDMLVTMNTGALN